jgi:hypothetical protein
VGAHDFHFAYAGAALAANTFGPFVLAGLALHVSALYVELKESMLARTRTVRFVDPAASPEKIALASAGGREKSRRERLLETVSVVALAYQSVIALHSCCAAAILRRHLMVWRVFAPKVRTKTAIASELTQAYVSLTCAPLLCFASDGVRGLHLAGGGAHYAAPGRAAHVNNVYCCKFTSRGCEKRTFYSVSVQSAVNAVKEKEEFALTRRIRDNVS